MPAMIWDSSTSAWKEADTPKTWGSSVGAWKDTDGYCWVNGVQKEAWSSKKEYELTPYTNSVNGQVITLPIESSNYDTGHVGVRVRTPSFNGTDYNTATVTYGNHSGATTMTPYLQVFKASDNTVLKTVNGNYYDTSLTISFSYNYQVYIRACYDGFDYGGGYIYKIVVSKN